MATERRGELTGAPRDGAPCDEFDRSDTGSSTGTAAAAAAPGRLSGSNAPLRASVVVATIGRPERIPALADAVLADPDASELVVVVDGPEPETERVLLELSAVEPRLRAVLLPHQGHLRALDAGVRAATGDVVVLLDDDVLPGPGTIGGHLRHHRHARGLAVVGAMPVVVAAGAAPHVATRLYAAEYLGHVARVERGDADVLEMLWGGNVSMRRDDCLRVGLASDSFMVFYHSDRDLGYRLADAGIIGVFDRSLGAGHAHSRSSAQFLRDARNQGMGRVALHECHAGRLGPFRPDELVEDLPAWLQRVVLLVGSSRVASPVGRALMAIAQAWNRLRPGEAPLVPAKLARRIMQWRGARQALASATSAGGGGRTAADPRRR